MSVPLIDAVLWAEFDIDRGATLRDVLPSPSALGPVAAGGLNEAWASRLAELMLPDGAHLRSEDCTVFILHARGAEASSAVAAAAALAAAPCPAPGAPPPPHRWAAPLEHATLRTCHCTLCKDQWGESVGQGVQQVPGEFRRRVHRPERPQESVVRRDRSDAAGHLQEPP